MLHVIPIIFSTVTGNAFKLAEAAADVVPAHCGPYNIRYVTDEMIEQYDTFILSYWCDKGSADSDTIALIEKMHGKKLIVIGTLGVPRESDHYQKVCERVTALASRDNTLLGHFLCQGSVDLCRTVKRFQEGKLTLERFERQVHSQGHPNAADLAEAREAVRSFLQNA